LLSQGSPVSTEATSMSLCLWYLRPSPSIDGPLERLPVSASPWKRMVDDYVRLYRSVLRTRDDRTQA
jgi:hypothetical protein